MLDTEIVCIRRLISHLELDLFYDIRGLVLQNMNDMIESIAPITDYQTKVCKVTISGEPYTLLEIRA